MIINNKFPIDSKKKINNNINVNNKNINNGNSLGNVKRDDVLHIIRKLGPSTVTQIKKQLNAEAYLVSAVLSELTNLKKVKTTNVKKGTAIFYYLPDQESKLEDLISFLNDKDQGTANLLKEKKVLEDKSQELFIRVSLRKMPDFARPINIRITENEIKLFWKYFLVSDEEAKEKIRSILSPNYNKEKNENTIESTQSNMNKLNVQEDNKEIQSSKKKEESKLDNQTKKVTEEAKERQELKKDISKDTQKSLIEENPKIEDKLQNDTEFIRVANKLKSKNIIIKEAISVRKGKDYDLIILMNTPIGETKFFAKYKNKKKCNEGDLSTAIVLGQSKQLPVAFITTGKLTKKTKEKTTKLFHNITIVEEF